LTPRRSETTQPIETKFETSDYVCDWKFFLSVPKIGQYLINFGVTISDSHIDVSHY